MRDDFTQKTKEELAARVGYKCSNPSCRKTTTGPKKEKGFINIGVAAHICAASKGGPRYDADMTAEERRAAKNGIWLCQSCAKLIDSDVNEFSVEKLNEWKEKSERMTAAEIERLGIPGKKTGTLIINSFLNINKNGESDEVITIDLINFFEGRLLKDEYEWETIAKEIKATIHSCLNTEYQYFVRLTTHFSVAFMAGRVLNPKTGIKAIPEQRTDNGTEVWDPQDKKSHEYEKLSLRIEELNDESYDIAIVVSITRNIERDVKRYIHDEKLPIGKICFCSFEITSINSIVDGKHAWEISKQISQRIESLIDKRGLLHIYVAAPISIMFNLGKMSLAYGKGTIYDYDLENKKSGTYYPTLDFSESDWME